MQYHIKTFCKGVLRSMFVACEFRVLIFEFYVVSCCFYCMCVCVCSVFCLLTCTLCLLKVRIYCTTRTTCSFYGKLTGNGLPVHLLSLLKVKTRSLKVTNIKQQQNKILPQNIMSHIGSRRHRVNLLYYLCTKPFPL